MTKDAYQGPERRQSFSCPRHEDVLRNFEQGDKRMERYERKIDDLLKGQEKHSVEIQELTGALKNGIRGDVNRMVTCMENLQADFKKACTSYDARLDDIDDFKWFRDWANSFRNSLIKRLLTVAFVGGTVIGFIYLFERGLIKLFH